MSGLRSARPPTRAATFRLCKDKPLRATWLAAFSFAVGALGVAFFEPDRAPLAIGLGLVFFALFYWISARARARARADRAPKIVVDRDGLALPDIFPKPLPWAAIESLEIFRNRYGANLQLRVDSPRARGYAPRGLALLPWSFGVRSISVDIAALEGEDEDLASAIRRFAPAALHEALE